MNLTKLYRTAYGNAIRFLYRFRFIERIKDREMERCIKVICNQRAEYLTAFTVNGHLDDAPLRGMLNTQEPRR